MSEKERRWDGCEGEWKPRKEKKGESPFVLRTLPRRGRQAMFDELGFGERVCVGEVEDSRKQFNNKFTFFYLFFSFGIPSASGSLR